MRWDIKITGELSTNSGDNFVDSGPVIPGKLRYRAKDEAWKRQISQFFIFKINELKIALGRRPNARFFNLAVHKSALLNALIDRRLALTGARNRLFYQAGSSIARTIACLKFMQCSTIKGKSRFTKRFYLFSTVFVDNFVENDSTTFVWEGIRFTYHKVSIPP
jgi:hypothetical protein